jgi:hypothetical protein
VGVTLLDELNVLKTELVTDEEPEVDDTIVGDIKVENEGKLVLDADTRSEKVDTSEVEKETSADCDTIAVSVVEGEGVGDTEVERVNRALLLALVDSEALLLVEKVGAIVVVIE